MVWFGLVWFGASYFLRTKITSSFLINRTKITFCAFQIAICHQNSHPVKLHKLRRTALEVLFFLSFVNLFKDHLIISRCFHTNSYHKTLPCSLAPPPCHCPTASGNWLQILHPLVVLIHKISSRNQIWTPFRLASVYAKSTL